MTARVRATDLRQVALDYQQQLLIWRQTQTETEKELVRRNLEPLQYQLWDLMLPDLHRMAYGWMRSPVAGTHDSIVMNLFAHMVERMERADLARLSYVRSFLCTLAWRGYADRHNVEKNYSQGVSLELLEHQIRAFDSDLPGNSVAFYELRVAMQIFWDTDCSIEEQTIGALLTKDVPQKEIAQQLHITYASVRKRIERLREKTRKHLVAIGLIADAPR